MQLTFSTRSALVVASLLLVSACGNRAPDSAFINHGTPESLLDVSSEVVNLSATNKSELKDLSAWIEKDQPTRAELNCHAGDKRCDETRKVLNLHGVPVIQGAGADQTVTLIYERILARDCNQRFEINRRNYDNTNYPSFGCSVAANMVQQVTDKQEFISPNLSDDPSAVRGVSDIHRAYAPRPIVAPYGVSESIVSKSKSE